MLTKAVVRAAALLELTQKELAGILGLSEATVSRLFAGRYLLARRARRNGSSRACSCACSARSTRCGATARKRAPGSRAPNLALAAAPRELLGSVEGLVRVVDYLDAARGRV